MNFWTPRVLLPPLLLRQRYELQKHNFRITLVNKKALALELLSFIDMKYVETEYRKKGAKIPK